MRMLVVLTTFLLACVVPLYTAAWTTVLVLVAVYVVRPHTFGSRRRASFR